MQNQVQYDYQPFVKVKNGETFSSWDAHKLKQGKKVKQKRLKPVSLDFLPEAQEMEIMRFDQKYEVFLEFIRNDTRIKDNPRHANGWAYYFGYIMGTPLKELPKAIKEHIAIDFPLIVDYLEYWAPKLRIGWFYFRNGVKDAQSITRVKSELFEKYFDLD